MFRKELYKCNQCFSHPNKCDKFQDIIGGYNKSFPIYIVCINPYYNKNRIESNRFPPPDNFDTFLEYSDQYWRIFKWSTNKNDNVDIKKAGYWIKLKNLLQISDSDLDIIGHLHTCKHGTPGEDVLRESEANVQKCASWVPQQFELLRYIPRLIIFEGGLSKEAAKEMRVEPNNYYNESLSMLHGKRGYSIKIRGRKVRTIFMYHVSRDRNWNHCQEGSRYIRWNVSRELNLRRK